MRVNRSVEHGVIVLMMLALAAGRRPQKSATIARVMGVSDSYLKKTLRRLVSAGLVGSTASKLGGYALARPAGDITLADAYRALDDERLSFRASPMAKAVFPDDDAHVTDAERRVASAFDAAHAAFLAELASHPITEYLQAGAWEGGCVDWGEVARGAGGR